MTAFRANLLANVLGRSASALALYLFVPINLSLLGVEAYGLVGFYAVLQGVLVLADLGFTATLNRHLALLAAQPGREAEMRSLVRSVEALSWALVAACGLALSAGAGGLARQALPRSGLDPATLVHTVRLMGWAVVLQLPATLYQGGLYGLQRQVASNLLLVGWNLLRHGGAVLLLLLLGRRLEVYFAWHLAANLGYSVAAGALLWRHLPATGEPVRFCGRQLRGIWRYAAGVAGISALSVALLQADKLIASRCLSLRDFSCYTLAAMIAQLPVLVTAPLTTALFPRFTTLVAQGDGPALQAQYRRACRWVAVLLAPAVLLFLVRAEGFLRLWTRSAEVAAATAPMARWFLAGSLLLALQAVPFNLALATGRTRINLVLAAVSLAGLLPFLEYAMPRYGGLGGAWGWFAMNAATLPALGWLINKKIFDRPGWTGLAEAWLVPCIASGGVMAVAWVGLRPPAGGFPLVGYSILIYIAGVAVGAALLLPRHRRRPLG